MKYYIAVPQASSKRTIKSFLHRWNSTMQSVKCILWTRKWTMDWKDRRYAFDRSNPSHVDPPRRICDPPNMIECTLKGEVCSRKTEYIHGSVKFIMRNVKCTALCNIYCYQPIKVMECTKLLYRWSAFCEICAVWNRANNGVGVDGPLVQFSGPDDLV